MVLIGRQDAPAPYLDEQDNPLTAPEEVYMLPTTCSMCGAPGYMKSIMEDIPHFREVLLMAFACSKCGYKSNEVRGGGAIPPKAKKLVLHLKNAEDLSRDVLKVRFLCVNGDCNRSFPSSQSETASVTIPEIELELSHGTLGGKFTTVEAST